MNTIIFDLGGVLVDWNPEYLYLKEFKGNRKEMKWFLENVCTPDWNEKQDGGRLIKAAVDERIKLYPKYEKLIKIFYDRWDEMLKGEITSTVEILKRLKKNYRLIALTNWSSETFPIALKKFDFLDLFEGIVVSGQINMRKPHKKIYNYTLKKYKLDPKKCLFIDDRKSNVNGAINCGIEGILYQSTKKLEIDLKKYEIKY